MSDNGVRYIYTQEQAEAELECQWQMAKARRAHWVEHNAADDEAVWIRKQNHIQNDLRRIDTVIDTDKMVEIHLAQKKEN